MAQAIQDNYGLDLNAMFASRPYAIAQQARVDRALRDHISTFDFYVDQVNGADVNGGTDPSIAWKTLAKVAASATAGKKVGLRRGCTWAESLTVPADNMVFGAYGQLNGAKPTIGTGATAVTDSKIGTIWQDIKIANFTTFGYIRQPAIGSAGGAFRRMTVVGPNGGGLAAQCVNWSQTVGGVIEDCDISNAYNGTPYPSGLGRGMSIGDNTFGLTIRYNRVADCYLGITMPGAHRNTNVHHNTVLRSKTNGIDVQGGTVGFETCVASNFVHHRPDPAGAAGHGIDVQLANCGAIWRNNVVVCDYTGNPANVEMYCLASTITGADVDYNLGYLMPGSTAFYGKLQSTVYTTLSSWQAALAAASVAGAEAHSVSSDPFIRDLYNEKVYPLLGSAALADGVALGHPYEAITDLPTMGAY